MHTKPHFDDDVKVDVDIVVLDSRMRPTKMNLVIIGQPKIHGHPKQRRRIDVVLPLEDRTSTDLAAARIDERSVKPCLERDRFGIFVDILVLLRRSICVKGGKLTVVVDGVDG